MQKNTKILIGCLLIILTLTGTYVISRSSTSKQTRVEKEYSEKPVEDKRLTSKNELDEIKEQEKNKEDITFLLMGVDEGERTDTLMVCKYFSSTKKVSILSVPRDTRTQIPGHGMDKINHANAFEGPNLALASINNLLDMNVEYYIRVDYDLVKDLVNQVGGVELYVQEDNDFWQKGWRNFNGDEAVEFLRFRAGYVNQDFGRMASQQEFLKQMLTKMKDNRNIIKISSMIKSGSENIDTNIPISKILLYGLELKNIDLDTVQMQTLPGESKRIDRISYIIVDENKKKELVDEMFTNEKIIKQSD